MLLKKNLNRKVYYNILSLILLGIIFAIYILRGPHYIQFPQDQTYQYFLNALNISTGHVPGQLLYPGITLNFISLVILFFINFFTSENFIISSLLNLELATLILSCLSTIIIVLSFRSLIKRYIKEDNFYLIACLIFYSLLSTNLTHQILSLFNSAEVFINILVITLLIIIKQYKNNYNTDFFVKSSIIVSLSITTKLTALPLAILPLLFIKNIKHLKIYFFTGIIVSFIISLPHIFDYDYIRNFYWEIRSGIISIASFERSQDGSFLSGIYNQQILLIYALPYMYLLFFLNFFFLIKFKRIEKINLLIIVFIIIYFLFLSARPKAHYFVPIIILLNFNLIEMSFVNPAFKKYNKIVFTVISLFFIYNHLNLPNQIKYWLDVKKDVKNIEDIIQKNFNDSFLLTAIHSSNKSTAIYHAHTGPMPFWRELYNIYGLKKLNYNWSDYSLTQKLYKFKSKDMIDKENPLLVWTSNGHYSNINKKNVLRTQKIFDAFFTPLYVGKLETLSLARSNSLKIFEINRQNTLPNCHKKFCSIFQLKKSISLYGFSVEFENNVKNESFKNFELYSEKKLLKKKYINGPWNSKKIKYFTVESDQYLKNFFIKSDLKIKKVKVYFNKKKERIKLPEFLIIEGKEVKQRYLNIKQNQNITFKFYEEFLLKKILINLNPENINNDVQFKFFINKEGKIMEIIPTSLSIKKNYKIFLFNKSEKIGEVIMKASYLDKKNKKISINYINFF